METLNLNVDAKTLEQCLKSVSDFGGTTYQNICTGASNFVAWGSVDWVLTVFILLIALGSVMFLLSMLWKLVTA